MRKHNNRVLISVYDTAEGLVGVGVVSKQTMRTSTNWLDAECGNGPKWRIKTWVVQCGRPTSLSERTG
jgi:hypothetical protein